VALDMIEPSGLGSHSYSKNSGLARIDAAPAPVEGLKSMEADKVH
jgi:hypothetical protein